MALLFWIITALDAVLFIGLMIAGLTAKGLADGGREMSLFFYVIVPAIIIGGGVLLFVKSESTVWRSLALLIVAGPGLLLAMTRIRDAAISFQIRQLNNGSGYFSGRDAKAAGAAVVKRDTAALRAAGSRIDVNTKGERGMTLMELAATQIWEGSPPTSDGVAPLDIVRELIALKADPNLALETATKVRDIALLNTLLDAGANPNYAGERGPVVFEWLGVMPIANFTAMLDHKLDPNVTDRIGTPLVVAAASADRWDIVQLLMARGVDVTRGDAQSMRLADVVKSRMESTMDRPAEMKADIARVKAQLSAVPAAKSAR